MHQVIASDKDDQEKTAKAFLERLKEHLSNCDKISLQSVKEWQKKVRNANEGLFLDEFVLPVIHEFLGQVLEAPLAALRNEWIRKAFLAESTKTRDAGLAWPKSPASKKKYLFTKVWANPKHVVKAWWEEDDKKGQTAQSCPDWGFRDPCPYKVVFEGNFFGAAALNMLARNW